MSAIKRVRAKGIVKRWKNRAISEIVNEELENTPWALGLSGEVDPLRLPTGLDRHRKKALLAARSNFLFAKGSERCKACDKETQDRTTHVLLTCKADIIVKAREDVVNCSGSGDGEDEGLMRDEAWFGDRIKMKLGLLAGCNAEDNRAILVNTADSLIATLKLFNGGG